MKKNKLLLMFFIGFISIFSFQINAYAAQELTCLYKKALTSDKVLLIQDSSGKIYIYKNKKNSKISDSGWYLWTGNNSGQFSTGWDYASLKDSNGYLKSCPGSKSTSNDGNGMITFYAGNDGKQKLESHSNKVELPSDQSSLGDTTSSATLEEAIKTNSCEKLKERGILDASKTDLLFTPSYDVNCIYYMSKSDFFKTKSTCSLVQLSYDSQDISKYQLKGYSVDPALFNTGFYELGNNNIGHADSLSKFHGGCPLNVLLTDVNGIHVVDIDSNSPNMHRLYATSIDVNIPSLIQEGDISIGSCEEAIGNGGVVALKFLWNAVRILVPVLLLIFGSMDFVQAIFAQDDGAIKKSQGKFIKRLIIAVIIFLLPTVLHVILNIAHQVWPFIDNTLCGILD